MEDKNDFEGAGFTLTYQKTVILVTRINVKPNAPLEVEYVGGKVEAGETPYQTAFAELVEEIGADILEPNWDDRATVLTTWQPFSKKWIWNFLLELTHIEFIRLTAADKDIEQWPAGELRSFETVTGRKAKARKAVDGICIVPAADLIELVEKFSKSKATTNRMSDAKKFGADNKLEVRRLSDATPIVRQLRGFNLVILEKHLEEIKHHLL